MKYRLSLKHFDSWRNLFIENLGNRIKQLERTLKVEQRSPLLKQSCIKNCLRDLHSKYVITPIDKASNNVALICKRFYAQILIEELGLNNSSGQGQTYTQVNGSSMDNIINKNIKDIKKKFGIDVGDDAMKVLPKMHWIPKMHKTPIKARFIVAAKACSLKNLAKSVTAVLKRFYQQIENYNKKSRFFSHANTFWVIQNKDPVVSTLNKLSARNGAKSVATYDFSTLYTKIPHKELKFVLNELIDFCFNGCPDSKIRINNNKASWFHPPEDGKKRSGKTPDGVFWNKQQVKNAIGYLLDNCYFSIGTSIFKQQIGIPMGSDPSPFMANLFLYYYENKFVRECKSSDKSKVRFFNNSFRFIDDLSIFNDNGEFEKNIKNIYPKELELKKENNGHLQATFLDLNIEIKNKRFSMKLYDKRDDFNFNIVRMPFASNNMPSRIFYSSFCSEILRIAKCTTEKEAFMTNALSLIGRLWKQGPANKEVLKSRASNSLRKLYHKHSSSFNSFFASHLSFVSELLS